MREQLSILIVSWNQTRVARRCLEQITGWSSVHPAVWLVDNASTDESPRAFEQEFENLHFAFTERNLGWGGGNNIALRQINTPYVLLLNADAALAEAGAARLLQHLEENSNLAVVAPLLETRGESGTIVVGGGRDISRHVRTHLQRKELERRKIALGPLVEVDYVPGAVAIWHTAVLRELGWFEESYFFGGEIAEMCELAKEKGYRVAVATDVTATHDLRQSLQTRKSLYPYYILRNRFLFIRRRRNNPLPLFAAWTAYGLLKAGSAALRGDLGSARLYSLGVIDGLANRSGNQNARVLGT